MLLTVDTNTVIVGIRHHGTSPQPAWSSPAAPQAGRSASRRTRARGGARVSRRARDPEADCRRPESQRRAHAARARFGSVPLAADQCRDVRGTAILDDLMRDVLYAFRTFRRAPLASLTVVATVALGLGLVAVVFTVYNFLLLRVDAVRNPQELVAVQLSRSSGPGTDSQALSFARPDYEALRARPASSPMSSRRSTAARRASTAASRGRSS